MNLSSEKALYLLPFDHRHSYVDGLFGFKPPLSASQREVIDSKQLIFDGFTQALAEGVPEACRRRLPPSWSMRNLVPAS